MTYIPRYKAFIFEDYNYNPVSGKAEFRYSFDGEMRFVESVQFSPTTDYDTGALDRALQLAFVLAGISYYKAFPAPTMLLESFQLTESQANFFNQVYKYGLSQFVYENSLEPDDVGEFEGSAGGETVATAYEGRGTLLLQSGGKDSLLLAELLSRKSVSFTPWYISQTINIPRVIKSIATEVSHPIRQIDTEGLAFAKSQAGLNGHVPITFITLGYALIDAILQGKNTILASIGHEGEEPHVYIGDYPVTHQWSKTWPAEQIFQHYVSNNIATIHVGSPLRGMSELKIAELFVEYGWGKYSRSFSSCNVGNYKLDHDNTELKWCGNCPKCANSYLLFSAFVEPNDLVQLFGGNLFEKESLIDDFKGLLGIDDVMKPFECVGEIDELRKAYGLALLRGYRPLPFDVPTSDFDKDRVYPSQAWATEMIQ